LVSYGKTLMAQETFETDALTDELKRAEKIGLVEITEQVKPPEKTSTTTKTKKTETKKSETKKE
jgi:hypothetical protein